MKIDHDIPKWAYDLINGCAMIIFVLCIIAWCVLWSIENKESCKTYEDGMKICVQDLQAMPKELQ